MWNIYDSHLNGVPESCTWTNAKSVSVVQNFELNWSRICFSFVLNHVQSAFFREYAPASSSASPMERVTVNGWLLQTREQRRNVPKTGAVWRKMPYRSEGQWQPWRRSEWQEENKGTTWAADAVKSVYVRQCHKCFQTAHCNSDGRGWQHCEIHVWETVPEVL